jgi:predicted GNAT family acetyltransferase
MAGTMTNAVVHNRAKNRFELDVGGETVFTEYREANGVMTFFHTLTPPALRGRGLAAKVVQAALDYARAEGLKVIPLCWYVSGHIQSHPELRNLLAPQAG